MPPTLAHGIHCRDWRTCDAGDVVPLVQAEIDAAEGQSAPMYGIERFAFYEKAKQAYCVIATGETRFYGCFLLTKGVVPPKG